MHLEKNPLAFLIYILSVLFSLFFNYSFISCLILLLSLFKLRFKSFLLSFSLEKNPLTFFVFMLLKGVSDSSEEELSTEEKLSSFCSSILKFYRIDFLFLFLNFCMISLLYKS